MASYRKVYFCICLVLDPCERQTAAVLMVETVGLAHAHDASARLSRRSTPVRPSSLSAGSAPFARSAQHAAGKAPCSPKALD